VRSSCPFIPFEPETVPSGVGADKGSWVGPSGLTV